LFLKGPQKVRDECGKMTFTGKAFNEKKLSLLLLMPAKIINK
jgi:hypothetical protein